MFGMVPNGTTYQVRVHHNVYVNAKVPLQLQVPLLEKYVLDLVHPLEVEEEYSNVRM